MEADLVKMSAKGQLVVPQDIRESLKLEPGERFVAFAVQEGVLFKKVDIPELKTEFSTLAKEIEASFRKNKVKKSDVPGAVKWARKQ